MRMPHIDRILLRAINLSEIMKCRYLFCANRCERNWNDGSLEWDQAETGANRKIVAYGP